MTKLLASLGLWGLFFAFPMENAASAALHVSAKEEAAVHDGQHFSAIEAFRHQLFRPNLQIQFVNTPEARHYLAGHDWQMAARSLYFPRGYDRLLRSSCQVKYPWQIRLLFPFHEFT